MSKSFSISFIRFSFTVGSLILMWSCLTARGQERKEESSKKLRLLPVPAMGYSPETRTYVGAVVLTTLDLYKDTVTRTSNIKAELNYTWRKQLITEFAWNYFFEREKWFTQGTLHYSKYPDWYYGIGETTAQDAQVTYESKRLNADINFLKNLNNSFFLGPKFRYLKYNRLEYDESVVYDELHNASNTGLGFTALHDNRNNLLNATKGRFLEVSSTYNLSGGDNYLKFLADARYYKQLRNELVIALRWVNDITVGSPPFYDYALLGGDKRARGYYYGRYRDRNLSTLQAEIRRRIIWRLGLSAFGGVSKVYASADQLSLNRLLPNYGAGIRFLIDRKQQINLRLDYAMGINGQNGFYIAFGESF